jgi:hypothetical protein
VVLNEKKIKSEELLTAMSLNILEIDIFAESVLPKSLFSDFN